MKFEKKMLKQDQNNSKYPLKSYDPRLIALERTHVLLIQEFENLAKAKNLDQNQISIYKNLIEDVYLKKKASYYFSNKLNSFFSKFNNFTENKIESQIKFNLS